MINSGAAITAVESAVNDPDVAFWSGGGFSNYFAAPSYQSAVLATFFADHKPTYASNIYNASGRGFPDVAALGMNIINYDGGAKILQGGTSASAPIFASIINLINEERIAAGKNSVGFLNPTLYANPSAFTDIVTGSNPGCGEAGFSAVTGWDPVTGLGTPIYSELLSVFTALP
jgi:tripeptidyl-peptidase-1